MENTRKMNRVLTPERNFKLKPEKGMHLRLGFANQSPIDIKHGMHGLFRAIKTQKSSGKEHRYAL